MNKDSTISRPGNETPAFGATASIGKQKNGSAPLLPPESVKRILVCQLRQIGDVLLSTPSVELLARHYPQAEIHFFTEKKCLPMLQGNPHIHTVWAVDKETMPSLLHELAFYRKVTDKGFDLVVDFQKLPRCRWVVALSGARVRLTESPPWYTRWLYTNWNQPQAAYSAYFKAQVLEPLGITWQGEPPRLYLSTQELAAGREFLQGLGLGAALRDAPDRSLRLVAVDATHRHETRQWPAGHYAALMGGLYKAEPGLRFLLPYGPGEEKLVRAIRDACAYPDSVIVPESLISLRHMAACMEHAVLHLGNCSAPRHMAVAMGVPTFTILGSTSSGWTFPAPEHTHMRTSDFMDMPCQPCNRNSCSIGCQCLYELTPERVLPAVLEHLEKSGR